MLVLDEPLSFWGGVDSATGVIVDRHHPQADASVAGTVLVLPGTRGSAGGSGTLAECLRLGTGPAAIVLPSADRSVVVGVQVVSGDAHASFRNGEAVPRPRTDGPWAPTFRHDTWPATRTGGLFFLFSRSFETIRVSFGELWS